MIEFLETFNQFIEANPTATMFIFLGCMVMFFIGTVSATHSLMLGIINFEALNCLNLTIYATAWLGLGLKPFLPLWLSLALLIAPFIIYPIVRKQLGSN